MAFLRNTNIISEIWALVNSYFLNFFVWTWMARGFIIVYWIVIDRDFRDEKGWFLYGKVSEKVE